jgi:MFS family permease
MNLITAIQLAAIPAMLIIAASVLLQRRKLEETSARRRWFFWLLALSAGFLLLLYLFRLLFPQVEMRFTYFLAAACLPVLLGMLALLLQDVGTWVAMPVAQKVLALLAAALVFGSAFFALQPYGYGVILLIGAVVLASAWVLNKLPAGLLAGLSLLEILLLSQWVNLTYRTNHDFLPGLARSLSGPLLFFLPVFAVLLAALLVYGGVRDADQPEAASKARWLSLAWRSGLALLLIGVLAYEIYWASLWDETIDGLGGISTAAFTSISAIAAGMIIGVRSPDGRKWPAGVFAILIPFVLFSAFSTGNGADYQALTARRAARIQAALEDYRTKHEAYPQDLQALVPGELLTVPQPAIFPSGGWCYQSGEDFYQLSTYYRRYFSTPLSLRVYAAAGNPPAPEPACQARLADLKSKYDVFEYPGP